VGYNVFLDQDFSRGHLRGGLGLELWYDWLRMAGNYYKPLSAWRPSEDFDSRYIQERPAEGFDVRLTGYVPFYRHLALNAAMERWRGEYVGALGHSERLYSDPTVLSGGAAWTPVPMVTVSGEARSSKSHTEGRFGLTLNYFFGVPIEEQLSPGRVAELTSVDNSRHDFVQRQNEIILEYRATPGRYIIQVTRTPGQANTFTLTVTDGFGKRITNLPVKFHS
jgi:adhesin/invasin